MKNQYKIESCKLEKEYIKVKWKDKKISKFHFLWLRDNCPTSFHKDTRMRKFNILSISDKINPLNVYYTSTTLKIIWSEGNHNSVFKLKWLRDFCYTEKNQQTHASAYKLWNAKIINNII